MASADPAAPLPPERIVLRDLLVRRWTLDDAPALHQAVTASYANLHRWVGWASRPSTLAAQEDFLDTMARRWDAGRTWSYAVLDLAETRLLGSAGIYDRTGYCAGDIAYWVHTDHTGRGIAFTCAAVLTGVALALPGADRVEIHCDQANVASAAVARKLGYRLDGIHDDVRDAPAKTGQRMVWTMTATAYPGSPAERQARTASWTP